MKAHFQKAPLCQKKFMEWQILYVKQNFILSGQRPKV